MKLTTAELEAQGYRKFMDNFKLDKDMPPEESPYKGTWQKRIVDKKGILFFIQVEMWDFANSRYADRNIGREPSFTAYAQLNLPADDTMNVDLLSVQNKPVMEIEAFFAKQWRINECEYYEEFNQG